MLNGALGVCKSYFMDSKVCVSDLIVVLLTIKIIVIGKGLCFAVYPRDECLLGSEVQYVRGWERLRFISCTGRIYLP